ncbi:uncharacterized protein METZ01_LOCUS47660 [marine metagenome]|uniref:Uncharacterized protein n=1 Tax=marine metagenome TaxID=408172 RepID=A0A381RSE9_9ZZZZ
MPINIPNNTIFFVRPMIVFINLFIPDWERLRNPSMMRVV